MKIRTKLFVLLASLILASLIVAISVSINAFSSALSKEIKLHLEDNSANIMKKISIDTSSRVSDIKFLGDSINISLNHSATTAEKKSDLFRKFLDTHKDYSSVSLYNRSGILVAGTGDSSIGKSIVNETFFKTSLNGMIFRGIASAAYLNSLKESVSHVLLSAPVRDKEAMVNEIVVFTYPLKKVIETSTVLVTPTRETKLKIDLISESDGKIIHSNHNQPSSFSSVSGGRPVMTTSFSNHPIYNLAKSSNHTVESGIFKDNTSPSPAQHLGNAIFVAAKENSTSTKPVAGSSSIISGANRSQVAGDRWILITAVDADEAFQEVTNLRNIFVVITVVILAISIIVIYFVVNRTISIPLTRLKDAAIQIGKGNLDLVVNPPSTEDEIGELSNQFGKMKTSIKKRTEELVEKENELEIANRALVKNEKAKDEFISMVSHELKTPLTPIKLYSDLLIKSALSSGDDPTEKQNKAIQIIRKSVSRLELLVNDILDVYKLDMHKLKFLKLDIDIVTLVDESILELKPQIEERMITLQTDFRTKSSVYCDPKRIGQVFTNLIKNAIDFVPDQGGIINVRVEEYNLVQGTSSISNTIKSNNQKENGSKDNHTFKGINNDNNLSSNNDNNKKNYDHNGKINSNISNGLNSDEDTNQDVSYAFSDRSSASTLRSPSSFILFTVEDNGIGIPEQLRDNLFRKFYQIDQSSTKRHGGTGLGLVICKGIVEAHGGKIWIDPDYNAGTSVKFTLPKSR